LRENDFCISEWKQYSLVVVVQFEYVQKIHQPQASVILRAVFASARFRAPFTPGFGVNGQSARAGPKDLAFLHCYRQFEDKVYQGYSPAGENAGSLMPFEMTPFRNNPVFQRIQTVPLPPLSFSFSNSFAAKR
jgi:hypothetical protein